MKTYRFETRRYTEDEGENRVNWQGPGWYAQRAVGNDIETAFIATSNANRNEVDRAAYTSGYGTPFQAGNPVDCR